MVRGYECLLHLSDALLSQGSVSVKDEQIKRVFHEIEWTSRPERVSLTTLIESQESIGVGDRALDVSLGRFIRTGFVHEVTGER